MISPQPATLAAVPTLDAVADGAPLDGLPAAALGTLRGWTERRWWT